MINSDEVIYRKVYVSLRPPSTISSHGKWTCDLDSDVARSSKDIQRIELKPNTQLSSTVRFVTKWSEQTLERTKFDRDTLNQEKHDKVTDPTSTERPVCGRIHRTLRVNTQNMLKMIKQVRRDPSRWIKRMNTTLISEYQDCHTQL